MQKFLYFAYGSNLNIEQMKKRCPDSEGICTGVLENWKLTERTHADIDQADGECVNGALYEISEDDLTALDIYEGYPEYYTRQKVMIADDSGKYREAFVYTMTDRYKNMQDGRYSDIYRQICSDGAEFWGIPNAFIRKSR